MIRLLVWALGIVFLNGCAVASLTPVTVQEPASPYRKLVIVNTDRPADLQRLDSVAYADLLEGRFNKLELLDFRTQLERTFYRNLNAKNSELLKSSDLFPVNAGVSFHAFLDRLAAEDAEAILLISLADYWHSTSTTYNTFTREYREDEEPNATFYCYLIDLETGEPVWMAKSVINGIWAGYDTLNNHLARKVAKNLRREGYVFYPVY